MKILPITVSAAVVALLAQTSPAAIIFDDFNINEGHFNLAPNFAGQSVGESSSSTADRVTTDGPLEGDGHQRLVLVHDGSATNLRIRHLSGGGTVGNNTSFLLGPDIDGFIGFYVKTLAQNFTIGINLDGADGAAASMDMGVNKPVIGDGQWHLYEWDLDDNSQWAPVTGIGGNGILEDGSHSIDSIYIFSNQTGTDGQAQPDIFIDFVAKSDSGSIAALVPEPSSLVLGLAGAAMLLRRRSPRSN